MQELLVQRAQLWVTRAVRVKVHPLVAHLRVLLREEEALHQLPTYLSQLLLLLLQRALRHKEFAAHRRQLALEERPVVEELLDRLYHQVVADLRLGIKVQLRHLAQTLVAALEHKVTNAEQDYQLHIVLHHQPGVPHEHLLPHLLENKLQHSRAFERVYLL